MSGERDLIAINYTSGTTGAPKGAMYRHRGAFLQAISMAYHARLDLRSVYLWTLPMFHCNGWPFPWAVAAAGATSLCTDSTDPEMLWRLIVDEGVTHFCAAPTLLNSLVSSPHAVRPDQGMTVATGGAPPTPALIRRAEALGLRIVHLYGLTETYGPSLICSWQPEWDALSSDEQAEKAARQGIPTIAAPSVRLAQPAGQATLGELTMAGNTVMAGYYRDPETTATATIDETRFRSGDLAVQHGDRYIELQDRAKDIIISGGENISSVEVERALAEHPSVSESAVVARAHDKWGEVPVAFVSLVAETSTVTPDDLVTFLRSRLAGFKVPREYHFGDLPKTATGKIRKVDLRKSLDG